MRHCGWLALALLVGCGAPLRPNEVVPPAVDDPVAAPMKVAVGPVTIHAAVLQPTALATIDWPAKVGEIDLPKQRKAYQKAKGAARQTEGQRLATALWITGSPDDAQILLLELAAAGDAPEDTLRLLAAAVRPQGDPVAAAALYQQLFDRFPQSADHERDRAQLAWYALVAGDTARAEALMKDADMKVAEAHDVAAWIHLRHGDTAGARAEIDLAVDGWRDYPSYDALLRESNLLAALDGVAPEERLARVAEVFEREGPSPRVRTYKRIEGGRPIVVIAESFVIRSLPYESLRLAHAYLAAGRADSAAVVLAKLPPVDPEDSFSGAEVALLKAALADIDGKPEVVAAALAEAYGFLLPLANAASGGATSFEADPLAMMSALAAQALELGVAYGLYADQIGNPGLGETAAKLLALHAKLNVNPNTSGHAAELDTNGKVGARLAERVRRARPVLTGCYLLPLQVDATLAGTVDVAADVADDGAVTVSSSEGLGPVGACVGARVAAWKVPGGQLSIKLRLQFAPPAPGGTDAR